jgi:putative transposase
MKKFYAEGDFYHVFNKSIANFGIFKDQTNSQRFIELLDYYNNTKVKERFSYAIKFKRYSYKNIFFQQENPSIKLISYCVMPDHYHLLIKIISENHLSKLISTIENSFTRYFNLKFKRKGPLWQSRFKSVYIESNEHLLHVSRYIHLNPTTSYLKNRPEDWPFSSYRKFIEDKRFLSQMKEISIDDNLQYKQFVENNLDYQRNLKHIRKMLLE